jgi:multimeric flavodoxin WrbA
MGKPSNGISLFAQEETMDNLKPIRIVALNGGPHRHGNTVTLMDWVLGGCKDMEASVEWLHIGDYDIRYCQGCFTCLRTGICPIKDDFLSLREELLAADGLVVGSPVYEGAPTAQLKTLMDRLTLIHLYTILFERQFSVGVATSGIAPTKEVAKGLASFFGRRSGYIGANTASVANGYRSLAEFHDARLPEKARRVGRRLVADIRAPDRFRSPQWDAIFFGMLWRCFVRPMAANNPEQFSGVLRILEQKGKLPERYKSGSNLNALYRS